jgi:hypothetical protein
MATIAPFNQDDENQDPATQNAGGGGEVLSSGVESAGTGGGVASGAGTSYVAPRQKQPGAPNISQYLNANKGAGQQLATGITSGLQNQANQLGKNVSAAQGTLGSQYNALNKSLGEEGQQTITSAFQKPEELLSAYNASKAPPPAGGQLQPQDGSFGYNSSSGQDGINQNALDQYNKFQKLNTGGYNQDISKYGTTGSQLQNNLEGQQQNLTQQIGNPTTESGRFQLLRNRIGQPTYNQGQQTLDALFLQAQPGAANQLKQNLGQIGTQAQQQVQGFGADTQRKLAALGGLSAQDQALVKSMFGGGLNEIGTNVAGEYSKAQATYPGQQEAMRQGILNNKLNPDQLAQLGLGGKTGEPVHTWGMSGQDILNTGQFTANPLLAAAQGGNAQVASPEEFARYNALNQLAGGPAGLQQNIFGNATQAGGYQPISFNAQGFQTAVDARKNAITGVDFQNSLSQIHNPNTDPVIAAIKNQHLNPEQAKSLIDVYGQAMLNGQSLDINNPGVMEQIIAGATNGVSPTSLLSNLAGMNMVGSGFSSRKYSPQEYYNAIMPNFNPFTNYYNQHYTPASNAILSPNNSPESQPLPINKDTGQIDWGAIAPPTGSAGKY